MSENSLDKTQPFERQINLFSVQSQVNLTAKLDLLDWPQNKTGEQNLTSTCAA